VLSGVDLKNVYPRRENLISVKVIGLDHIRLHRGRGYALRVQKAISADVFRLDFAIHEQAAFHDDPLTGEVLKPAFLPTGDEHGLFHDRFLLQLCIYMLSFYGIREWQYSHIAN